MADSSMQPHTRQRCREWSAHNASDGDGPSSEAGIGALLQQVLEEGQVGHVGVVRHVRAAHERRPAPAQVVLVDLHLPVLYQEPHTLQLQGSMHPPSVQVHTVGGADLKERDEACRLDATCVRSA